MARRRFWEDLVARLSAIRWAFSILLTGLVLAAGHAAMAVPASAVREGRLAFTVTRNGEPIGSQVYHFDRHGRRVIVDIRTDIDFRLLSLPIYRFRHESREIWDGDRLIRLISNTDDNGDPVSLDVRAEGRVLKVGGAAGQLDVDPKAVPASLWNPVVVQRDRLLDPVDGTVMTTKVAFLGEETLAIGDRKVQTRKYRLSGDYSRDLWYDSRDGSLVRVQFKGPDGSELEYVLKN
jgi:hypothetical protein